MKRMVVGFAAVMALLAGCGGRGAAPANSQVHVPEVEAPAQPAAQAPGPGVNPQGGPQSAPPPPAQPQCEAAGQDLEQNLAVLLKGRNAEQAVAAQGKWPDCVTVVKLAGGETVLAYVRGAAPGTLPAELAWQEEGAWHTARVAMPVAEANGFISGGAVIFSGGRPNLLVADHATYAAGGANLLSGAYEAPGAIKMRPLTGVPGKANYEFLRPDLVLVTYRGEMPGPIAPSCEACMPVNNQKLWEWNGVDLKLMGERVFSDPLLTASLFLGRLQQNDQTAARLYVSPPDLLPQLVAALGDPQGWITIGYSGPLSEVHAAEWHNWDLLPEALRSQVPQKLQSQEVEIRKVQSTLTLQLNRKADGWIITGFKR